MSRFTKEHYKDVALVLSEKRIYFSHLYNDAQAIVAEQVGDRIAHSFADLFAADNPKCCIHCGYVQGATEICSSADGQLRDEHHFEAGFDREQFLAACGLEPKQAEPRHLGFHQ